MPLELLGPLVVVGIGAIVLLVHLLGWSEVRALDAPEALALLREDYPDVEAKRVVMGDDGAAALVETAGGLGLVRAMGAGRLTRLLRPGEATARGIEGGSRGIGAGLRVIMTDFGAPEVAISLADPARRAEALAMARRALGEDG